MQTASRIEPRHIISCDIPLHLTNLLTNRSDYHLLPKNDLTKLPRKGDISPTKSEEKSQGSTRFSDSLSSQHNDPTEESLSSQIPEIESPMSIIEDSPIEEEQDEQEETSTEDRQSLKASRKKNRTEDTVVLQTRSSEIPTKNTDIPSYQQKISKLGKKDLIVLSSEDEQVLLRLVVQLKNSWKKITKRFNKLREKNASLTLLKKRYNLLMPKLFKKKGKFTHQEDLLLAKYYSEFGCDWGKISNQIKNRTPNMLKNRYYSHIKKRRLLNDLLQELKTNTPVIPEKIEKIPIEGSIRSTFHRVDLDSLIIFKGEPGNIQSRVLRVPVIDDLALEMFGGEIEDSLVDKIKDGYVRTS